jgi:glyoxylase-like metal-dependent hydrolase (beta-lactamase superfamily II)
MIKHIAHDVYCFHFRTFGSKVYLIKNKGILIDTSSKANNQELLADLKSLGMKIKDIKAILLTHMHIDHVGGIFLFDADIYADKDELESFVADPVATTLTRDEKFLRKMKQAMQKGKIKSLEELDLSLAIKVIKTPGHTAGSVCYKYKDVLFSGDTVFDENFFVIGRVDLPTSNTNAMENSLKILARERFRFLCPGH